MERESVPNDLNRFILLGIPSVPYLEAMLLLHATPKQQWDDKQASKRLYLSEKAAQQVLLELVASGVATADHNDPPQYRYQPQSEALALLIDRLAEFYPRNLVVVSDLIHSKTNKKAQQFADAFVLRKGP